MDFGCAVVDEETTEKRPNMVINQVSLGTGEIDISSNDNFGLSLEINIDVSNKFDAAVAGRINTTHRIIQVGTSVSQKSLSINHEIVHERWGIHPSVYKNMVELKTQRGVRILFPHPLIMKRMSTKDRMLQYKRLPCNVFSDTIISGTSSKRGNKYAEVFATYF